MGSGFIYIFEESVTYKYLTNVAPHGEMVIKDIKNAAGFPPSCLFCELGMFFLYIVGFSPSILLST